MSGKVKLSFVRTACPQFYDLSLPHFQAPRDWTGHQLRVKILLHSHEDYQRLIDGVREKTACRYPGALVHVEAEFSQPRQVLDKFTGRETDREKLGIYMRASLPQSLQDRQAEIEAYLWSKLRPFASAGVSECEAAQFNRVRAVNTLCFRQVELPLDRPGIHLVVGDNGDWGHNSNGAGKSALLSLLRVGLYGSTTKGQHHDLLCRRGASPRKASYVKVLYQWRGQRYCVVRHRRPRPRLQIRENGRDVSIGNIPSGTQAEIERRCGLSENVFDHSVLVDQKLLQTAENFLYGTDKQKKELLDALLGTERFAQAAEAVRQGYDCWMAEAARTEGLAALLKEKQAFLTAQIRTLRKNPVEHKLMRERAWLEERLAAPTYQGLELRCDEIRLRIARAFREQAGTQAELKEVWHKLQYASTEYRDSHRTWRQQQQMRQGRCPLCLRPLDKRPSRGRIAILAARMKEAQGKQVKIQREAKRLEALADQQTRHLGQARSKERFLAEHARQFARLQDRLKWLRQREQNRPESVLLQQAQKRLRQMMDQSKMVKRSLEVLHGDAAFWNYCLSVFSREGIVNYIYAGLCRRLNAAASDYSRCLTDGVIQLVFSPQMMRKKGQTVNHFEVQVVNLQGGADRRDQSRGEEQLAALICVLALRAVGPRTNLLILDEPVEGLDRQNALRFAEGLKKLQRQIPVIFLATHNETVQAEFRDFDTLKVAKQNRIAQLV